MEKITRVNVILKVPYLLQVYVALLDHHPRLPDLWLVEPERYDKRVWWSDNSTQTCNRYETLSIIFTCVMLSVWCTESYGTRWYKGVKYVSPSTKRFSRYLHWYSIASKSISCVRTKYKKDNIFIWCFVWWKFFSALAYTSQPYSEAMVMRPEVTYTPCATSARDS